MARLGRAHGGTAAAAGPRRGSPPPRAPPLTRPVQGRPGLGPGALTDAAWQNTNPDMRRLD
eukprot:4725884-Pyramimonas_sp.AAC.1